MLLTDQQCLEIYRRPRAELIQLAEAHTLTVQAWLSSRSPEAKTFQGRGVRASSTGFKIPLLNLALGCNFPEGMDEDEIGAEVEAVKRFFAERGAPWYWWMNSEPSPKHISRILEQRGLVYDDPPLPAMIAPKIQNFATLPTYDRDIHAWRANSIADLQSASKIRRIAFGFKEGEALTYFEDMARDWLSDESAARLYLAGSSESDPVSIGAVIHAAGIPGIYVMATLPEHHRKGYGKAALTALLLDAARMEGDMVALTASSAGAGLYSQFGFRRLFAFDFYSIPDEV